MWSRDPTELQRAYYLRAGALAQRNKIMQLFFHFTTVKLSTLLAFAL